MRISNKHFPAVLIFLVNIILSLPGFSQTTYTWFGGGGNWNTPSNWQPNGVPGANDVAIINSGTVLVTGDVTVNGFSLNGGVFYGAGKLSVSGTLAWTSGDIVGDTTLAGADTIEILPGALMAMSGTNSKDLRDRVLVNKGTVSWTDPGNFELKSGAKFINKAGGIFNIQTDALLNIADPNANIFENAGTVNKSAGPGVATLNIPFFNSGSVNAISGTLRFKKGGTHSGVTLNAASGGIINFNEGIYIFDGVTISGQGKVQISGDSVAVASGGLTVDAFATLELANDLSGNGGTITVNGTFSWSKGFIYGPGALTINGTIDFNGNNSKIFDNITVTNHGMAVWSGSGDVRLKNNAFFNNTAGANFQIQTDAQFDFAAPDGGTFLNSGNITKSSGGGTAAIDVDFTNNGTVNINSGALLLSRGSHNSSVYTIASGAALQVGALVHDFEAASLVNGDGDLTFTGGGNSNFAGTFSASGTLTVSSGVLNFNGAYNGNGPLVIDGGTCNLNVNLSPANLTLTGGILSGSGTVNVSNIFNWNGGTINKSAFASNGIMNVDGAAGKTLDGGAFNNTGVALVNGSGAISLKNNVLLENQAGATINFLGNLLVDFTNPGGGVFINNGTVTRSGNTGECTIDVDFTNNGTLNVSSGTLKLTRSSAHNNGTVNTAAGALLQFSVGAHNLNSVNFSGSGTVELTSTTGTLNIMGSGVILDANVTLALSGGVINGNAPLAANGPFTWSKGTISGANTFSCSGPVSFNGTNTKLIDGQVFSNSGSLTWSGTADILLANGALLENKAGATFQIQTDAQIDFAQPLGGVFTNAGSVVKTNSSGATSFDVEFTNNGILNLSSGSLELKRNSTFSGVCDLAAGSVLHFNGGSHNFNGLALQGEGTLLVTNNGTIDVNSPGITGAVSSIFEIVAGTMNLDAPAVFNGTFNWNAGSINGPASLAVNGTMNLLGGVDKILDAINLTNTGAVNLIGAGDLRLVNNTILNNQAGATFDIRNNIAIDYLLPNGGSFNNSGTVIKSGGGGMADFNIDFLNQGVLDIRSGGFVFTKTLSNDVSGSIQGNGTLGVFTANFLNDGTVKPGTSPGALTISGNYPQSASGLLQIEIGGYTAGSTYDRLNVQGSASFNGTLEVSLANNFVPTLGDTFKVAGYSSRTGQFANFISPTLNGQPIFNVSYLFDSVVLTTVLQMNRYPVALNDSVATAEETTANLNVLANDYDPDNDAISIINYTQAANGAVTQIGDSSFTYQPLENFFGADTFSYIIVDVEGKNDTARVVVTVLPVNDPPLLNLPAELTFSEDDSLSLGLNTLVADIDDPLQNLLWSVVFPGAPGLSDSIQVIFDPFAELVTFIPNPNFYVLNQQMIIAVCDTSGACDQDTILLNILPVNDPPVISGLPANVTFNSNASATVNIWQYVHDVETADPLLTYIFSVSNDSLLHTYNSSNGDLILSAIPGFSGTVSLAIQVSDPQNALASDTLEVIVNLVVGIDLLTNGNIPREFAMQQNYPNPFNPVTTIKFQLPAAEDVKLSVYNILGQKVRTLVNERLDAGYYQVVWDGLNEQGVPLASGFYIFRIEAGDFRMVRKMTLLK